MDLFIKTISNETHGTLSVADNVFSQHYNEPLIHQIVTAYLAGGRQGTRAQKDRSEVSGSNAKPWRQKGTGRARAGTTRSPIFRKGGVAFAAKTRSYKKKVNRKMYRAAMQSILSELLRKNRLTILDDFSVQSTKTKDFLKKVEPLNIKNALIIISPIALTREILLSSRNIKNIDVISSLKINPYILLSFDKIFITQQAIKQIEERLL